MVTSPNILKLKMKIHLLSDLHLEFYQKPDLDAFIQPADVLVLAGDINVGRTNTLKTLKYFGRKYEHVVYVPGNHEYYGGLELNGFNIHSEFGYKLPNNIHFLNPGCVILNHVNFIGATLWTNFREDPFCEIVSQSRIVDFRRIPDATPARMKELFYLHSQYIKVMYEQMEGKKVIVTHFLPASQCVHPRWGSYPEFVLNGYFANDLGDWIEQLEDTTWLFGHTHDYIDVTIGTTNCIANPLGYPQERPTAYEHRIIEV